MTDFPSPGKAVCDCVQALASKLFGQTVGSIEFVPRGVMNHKFKVTLRDDSAYGFRFYPSGRERIVNFEPDLISRYAAVGLPVPKVLTDSRSGPAVGQCYMVYHWIEGQPMDKRMPFLRPNQLTLIARELVEFLKSFTRLPVAGFGELESATKARYRTWREFLETSLAESLTAPGGNQWDQETVKIFKAAVELAASAAPEQKPVLAWGDISPENIVLDDQDRIAGMLDFEGTLAADFSLTIGYCQARFLNTPFFESLWRAWPKNERGSSDQTLQILALLRGLRLARFAGSPLPTGQARKPLGQILPGFPEALNRLRSQLI